MTTYLSNTAGLQLLCCSVTVEQTSPRVASSLSRKPIVAFRVEDDQSLTPVVMSGPIEHWREHRRDGHGVTVWAVSAPSSGVHTAEKDFAGEEAFKAWAEQFVANDLAKDSQPMGWSPYWPAATEATRVEVATERQKSASDTVSLNLRDARQRAENETIRQALALSCNNISRTAEMLGITRPTLYDLMEKNEIVLP